MSKRAIAIHVAIAGMVITHSAKATPISPARTMVGSADVSIITQVRRASGSVRRSTVQFRTFRPTHVARVRPTFAPIHVRPGRPLAHRSVIRPGVHKRKHHGRIVHRKRPRPFYVHVTKGTPPDPLPSTPSAWTAERALLSPDFCRYWGDRGDLGGYWDHCW